MNKLLPFLIIIIFVSSCKKDNPSTNSNLINPANLIGTWILQSITSTKYSNNAVTSTSVSQGNSSDITIFKQDNTGSFTIGASTTTFTYSLSADTLVYVFTTGPGHYILKGTVKTLTSNKLETITGSVAVGQTNDNLYFR